jgi:hypothetical protein
MQTSKSLSRNLGAKSSDVGVGEPLISSSISSSAQARTSDRLPSLLDNVSLQDAQQVRWQSVSVSTARLNPTWSLSVD